MSGPIQIQDTGDRWSHKHVSLNGRLFFTHSTIFAGFIFPENGLRRRLCRRYL
jgi:hypothetical protein